MNIADGGWTRTENSIMVEFSTLTKIYIRKWKLELQNMKYLRSFHNFNAFNAIKVMIHENLRPIKMTLSTIGLWCGGALRKDYLICPRQGVLCGGLSHRSRKLKFSSMIDHEITTERGGFVVY